MTSENPSKSSGTVGPVRRSKTNGQGRHRQRASLACMNCRQRKIKCDAQTKDSTTTCTPCRTLNIQCTISRDGDRRKAGSRDHVSSLQDRIQMLETLMKRNFQPEQDIAMDHSSTFANGAFFRQPTPSSEGDGCQAIDNLLKETDSFATINQITIPATQGYKEDYNQGIETSSTGQFPQDAAQHMPQLIQGEVQSQHVERLTPPLEEERGRLDVDVNHGQPRFYGPTSQHYIQYPEGQVAGPDSYENADPDFTVRMDSTPLRKVLLQAFWKIQLLSTVTVNEELFSVGYSLQKRTQYYSTFLELSVLACATRMSTSPGVRRLGGEFAEQARAEIPGELVDPNVASLQGFLLLSDFESTRGRDRLGYLYSGLACRLIFDLGLHEDCSILVKEGKLTSTEADFRHLLFLGTFVFDKLWGLYLGRPGAIPLTILSAAEKSTKVTSTSKPMTIDPWVYFCVQLSEVTGILNSSSPLDQSSLDRLRALDTKFTEWHRTLPAALTYNDMNISELNVTAYGLHMQYCGIRIIIHRLLSKVTRQKRRDSTWMETDIGGQGEGTLEHSRVVMYENAVLIARLVSTYQQIFGTENMITIMLDNMFVAATVLISRILRPHHQDLSSGAERDTQWLRMLGDIMQHSQKHYPVAARMRYTLSTSVENTILAGMFGSPAPTNLPGEASGSANHSSGGWNTEGQYLLAQDTSERSDNMLLDGSLGDRGDRWFQESDMNDLITWSFPSQGE